ncbi:MAG: CRISPR-associated CARF protein Csa3 [Candidatus Aenigmarchaeota archaeon]|nr:CRISPR-associated CARF protein Csa3 [Candidatus Aenigmarchaeota archaeon]
MARILISTVYSADSIVLAITRLSVSSLFLLVDKRPNAEQLATVKKIKDMFGKALQIQEKKIDIYEIVPITRDIVSLIDFIPITDEIYVNITPSRKPQALGLLFASYKRNLRIKRIMYVIDENNEIIDLPILSFDLNPSQLSLLKSLEPCKAKKPSITSLSKDLKISRAMLYRNLKSLKDKGLIEDKNGSLCLTDAGRIAGM